MAALPLRADDISFNPAITQQDFQKFSRIIAQGMFPSPIQPAGASGLTRFDIGIAATAVQVDPNASYWLKAVNKDITLGRNYVAVPRLVVTKGLGAASVSGSYAKLGKTGGSIAGGSLDIPIINGGVLKPTLALRGSYSTLRGIDVYRINTYGAELFLGKGFGPITPYGAIGKQRSDATGTIPQAALTLRDRSTLTRYTLGAAINLLILRVNIEANQAEMRSYGARVSFGF